MNKLQLINQLTRPAVSLPATGLAAAGLTAYGNALAENEYQKGDNRLIAESLLGGLGAVAGGYGAYRLGSVLNRSKAVQRMAGQVADQINMSPEQREFMAKLTPILAPKLLLGTTGAGLGAGVGVGAAGLLSAQANLMGLPNFSNRQQDYYEEDYKPPTDQLTEEDIQLLKSFLSKQGQN